MEGFRQRVTACFGIPGNTTLDYMAPPLVAVMNRPPGKGRSIHNGDEVAAVLHQQFSGQGAIVKHIRFNEAMTIREQAAVYNQIAVLVQVSPASLRAQLISLLLFGLAAQAAHSSCKVGMPAWFRMTSWDRKVAGVCQQIKHESRWIDSGWTHGSKGKLMN